MGDFDEVPAIMPTTVTFQVTPLAKDDTDRKELTCVWCNLRGCDGTIMLLGGGRTIISGLHAHCLQMHEQVLEARLQREFAIIQGKAST
jgi:hypothetical protein